MPEGRNSCLLLVKSSTPDGPWAPQRRNHLAISGGYLDNWFTRKKGVAWRKGEVRTEVDTDRVGLVAVVLTAANKLGIVCHGAGVTVVGVVAARTSVVSHEPESPISQYALALAHQHAVVVADAGVEIQGRVA